MKLEELTKEYKLSEEVTLTDGTVKTVSIIVTINNNSVAIKPGVHMKEFVFNSVKITEDKIIEWEAITKLMCLSNEVIKNFLKKADEEVSKEKEAAL